MQQWILEFWAAPSAKAFDLGASQINAEDQSNAKFSPIPSLQSIVSAITTCLLSMEVTVVLDSIFKIFLPS